MRLLTLTGAAGSGKTRLALEATGFDGERDRRGARRARPHRRGAGSSRGRSPTRSGSKERPGRLGPRGVARVPARQASAAPSGQLRARARGRLIRARTARRGARREGPRDQPRSSRCAGGAGLPRAGTRAAGSLAASLAREAAARPRRSGCSSTEPAPPGPTSISPRRTSESVVELCVRLDGLPLALELAAARCNLLSPGALLKRLGSRLDLLRAAPGSGLVERQWTLRGAIEWSYDLLEPEEQQLFASLAVFVGGFTLAAAEQVAEQPDLDILEGAETLFRNNLLTTEHAAGDDPRLGMLETIREYALERLAARGDGGAVRRRHAAFYLVLAEDAEPGLLGPQQREWLERLDAERDNIRAALGWALDAGEAEIGLTIGSALWRFWQLRNHELEARERLEELLALGSGSARTRAKAQTMVGSLSFVLGEFETARRVLQESLRVHRRLGDTRMIASTLGLLAVTSGDPDSALALSREVARGGSQRGRRVPGGPRPLARRHGTSPGRRDRRCRTRHSRTRSESHAVRKPAERRLVAEVARRHRDHPGRSRPRAGVSSKRAWPSTESLDDAWGVSHSLSNLSYLALDADDPETARALLSQALAIERESGHQPRLANALEMSARLAAADGEPALAIRLYAAPRCSASACTA